MNPLADVLHWFKSSLIVGISVTTMDRIVKLRKPIQVVLSNLDLISSTLELAAVLKPLKLITELLSGDSYLIMSSVYPTLTGLINKDLQAENGDTFMIKTFKKLQGEI